MVETETSQTDPTKGAREGFCFECGARECKSMFTSDELPRILKSAARHWNREHADDLKHGYEAIDEVQVGGHHIQGESYEVRKYKVYITAFDVAKRLGAIDGKLVADSDACPDCYCRIPNEEDRVEENPDDAFCDEWKCATCAEEQEIERKANENESLGEWCG